ncbi:MAG TPA: type II toxin-antitoxin system VapC family toxin [Gemmataceae bacterium]|nr:type II toxin-antitoxin system VapC family toxin [Gemmataceae bacterium]
MPVYLLDTNHLRLLENCQPTFMGHFLAHRPTDVATSIVCVQEVLKGRLGALTAARKPADLYAGYRFLNQSLDCLSQLPIVLFDAIADRAFQTIRALRIKSGTQDQRIAATALANGLTLVTGNTRHFVGVPGLQLADWSV